MLKVGFKNFCIAWLLAASAIGVIGQWAQAAICLGRGENNLAAVEIQTPILQMAAHPTWENTNFQGPLWEENRLTWRGGQERLNCAGGFSLPTGLEIAATHDHQIAVYRENPGTMTLDNYKLELKWHWFSYKGPSPYVLTGGRFWAAKPRLPGNGEPGSGGGGWNSEIHLGLGFFCRLNTRTSLEGGTALHILGPLNQNTWDGTRPDQAPHGCVESMINLQFFI